MVKIIRILFLITVLTSCVKNKVEDNCYLEINNKELIQQIKEYKHFSDSINRGRPYVLNVSCYGPNDSTEKYTISSSIDAIGLISYPYHFICKVENYEVFFTMVSGNVESPYYVKTDRNFFKLKQNAILEYIKKYFPKDYEKYENYLKTGNFPCPDLIYEPESLHLKFINGRLVKKIFNSRDCD